MDRLVVVVRPRAEVPEAQDEGQEEEPSPGPPLEALPGGTVAAHGATSHTSVPCPEKTRRAPAAPAEQVGPVLLPLERPDDDVARGAPGEGLADRHGVVGLVDRLDVLLSRVDLGRRRPAPPEPLVVRPAEEDRAAGRSADPSVVAVGAADGLHDPRVGRRVLPDPLHGLAVPRRLPGHPGQAVERHHGGGPPLDDEAGRMREETRHRHDERAPHDPPRPPRGEGERQEERRGRRQQGRGGGVALEDGVHPVELLAVRVADDDELRHEEERDARPRQEETGPQRALQARQEPQDGEEEGRPQPQDGPLRHDREEDPERREGVHEEKRLLRVVPGAQEGDPDGEGRDEEERPEVQERLRARRPAGHPAQALELGPRRQERREEEGKRDRERRDASQEGRLQLPRREGAGAEQEERARKVPRVGREEGRQERGVEEEAGPGGEAPHDRREGEEERQGHRVRVEVPEPEREEGPLGDRVRDAPRGGPEVDVPERRPGEELARAVERPREGEEERRRDRRSAPAPPEADDPERRGARQRRDERDDEVVGVLRRDGGEAEREREDVRAEVVVREPLSREPRVFQREPGRDEEVGEDREVHRLLRPPDVGPAETEPEVEREEPEQDQRGNEEVAERRDQGGDEGSRRAKPSEPVPAEDEQRHGDGALRERGSPRTGSGRTSSGASRGTRRGRGRRGGRARSRRREGPRRLRPRGRRAGGRQCRSPRGRRAERPGESRTRRSRNHETVAQENRISPRGRLPPAAGRHHNSRMLEDPAPAPKSPRRIAVVGGGLAGLVAADRLLAAGHSVVVFEKYPEAGGLVGTFSVGGEALERFYHHLFTSDVDYVSLAEELGLGGEIEWLPSKMGFYSGGRLYPFGTPASLLGFSPLGVKGRLELVLSTLRLRQMTRLARPRGGDRHRLAEEERLRPRPRRRLGTAPDAEVRPARGGGRPRLALGKDRPQHPLARQDRPRRAARLHARLLRPRRRGAPLPHRLPRAGSCARRAP